MKNFRENSFPISKGRVNLESGSISGTVLCVADGDITVTWDDDTTSVVSLVAGNAIDISKAKSASVTSGTYHSA